MSPEISIIVPIYKVEPYLKRCVDSILGQTFSNFELILVDDGSPDNCGKICDEYLQKDSRVKVIHKVNGGLSSARNAGLDLANGKYVGFVDSDDYIHQKMFQVLHENAEKYTANVVICDFLKVYETECFYTEDFSYSNILQFTNIQALNELYTNNNIKFVVVWNKLYDRTLFKDVRFPDGKSDEDEFIAHRTLYNTNKVIYVQGSLYYYLQRNNSIVGSPFNIRRLDKVYALEDRFKFFRTVKQLKLKNKAEKDYVDSFFWNYYKAKKELTNVDEDLKKLEKNLNKNLSSIIRNPLFGLKHKIALVLFAINPKLYELI
jgi:glycosyltransferase involved in cell wall biosynthesis